MPRITRTIVTLPRPLYKADAAVYVGVDCAPRNSGVCILSKTEARLYGVSTGKLRGTARLLCLHDAVERCLGDGTLGGHIDVAAWCIEDGVFDGSPRRFLMGQAHSAATLALVEFAPRAAHLVVQNALIKQFFAGTAGAKKERMVKQINADLDTDFSAERKPDDDLADAYACALLAYSHTTKDILSPHRRRRAEVIAKIRAEEAADPWPPPLTFDDDP